MYKPEQQSGLERSESLLRRRGTWDWRILLRLSKLTKALDAAPDEDAQQACHRWHPLLVYVGFQEHISRMSEVTDGCALHP